MGKRGAFCVFILLSSLAHAQIQVPPQIQTAFDAFKNGGTINPSVPAQAQLIQLYFALHNNFNDSDSAGNTFTPFRMTERTLRYNPLPEDKAADAKPLTRMELKIDGATYTVREAGRMESWLFNFYSSVTPDSRHIGSSENNLLIEDSSGKLCGLVLLETGEGGIGRYSVKMRDPKSFYRLATFMDQIVKSFDTLHGTTHSSYYFEDKSSKGMERSYRDFFGEVPTIKILAEPVSADARPHITSSPVDPKEVFGPVISSEVIEDFANALAKSPHFEDKVAAARLMANGAMDIDPEKLKAWTLDPKSPQQLRLQSLWAMFRDIPEDKATHRIDDFAAILTALPVSDQIAFVRELTDRRTREGDFTLGLHFYDQLDLLPPHVQSFLANSPGQGQHNAFAVLNDRYLGLFRQLIELHRLEPEILTQLNDALKTYIKGQATIQQSGTHLDAIVGLQQLLEDYIPHSQTNSFKDFVKAKLADLNYPPETKRLLIEYLSPDERRAELRRELVQSVHPEHLSCLVGLKGNGGGGGN